MGNRGCREDTPFAYEDYAMQALLGGCTARLWPQPRNHHYWKGGFNWSPWSWWSSSTTTTTSTFKLAWFRSYNEPVLHIVHFERRSIHHLARFTRLAFMRSMWQDYPDCRVLLYRRFLWTSEFLFGIRWTKEIQVRDIMLLLPDCRFLLVWCPPWNNETCLMELGMARLVTSIGCHVQEKSEKDITWREHFGVGKD